MLKLFEIKVFYDLNFTQNIIITLGLFVHISVYCTWMSAKKAGKLSRCVVFLRKLSKNKPVFVK